MQKQKELEISKAKAVEEIQAPPPAPPVETVVEKYNKLSKTKALNLIYALSFNDTKTKKMVADFKVAHPQYTATSNPKISFFETKIPKDLITLTDLVNSQYGVLYSSFNKLSEKYIDKDYDLISSIILKYYVYQIASNFYNPTFILTNDEQILISENKINIKNLTYDVFGGFNNAITFTGLFKINPLPSIIPYQK